MKKMKLRKEVKLTLIIGGILVLLIAMSKYTDNSINDCVKAGHTQNYCEMGLR